MSENSDLKQKRKGIIRSLASRLVCRVLFQNNRFAVQEKKYFFVNY